MLKLTNRREKWFAFPQDESGESRVYILHLKPGEIAEIEERSNQVIGKQKGDTFVTEVEFKLHQRKRAILDACIIDWEGLELENGEKAKCTLKNKIKFLSEFDWFFGQIEEFRAELAEEVEADEEGATKNSLPSATGTAE